MTFRRTFIAFAGLLLFQPFCARAEGPAVSGPNAKISVEGGSYDDQSSGLALGSFTVPLGTSFGLQADGAVGTIDDIVMGGGGLHLFTRDPSRYLLGVYGSYHTWDDINIWRAAAEGELYLNRFTFSGIAGYESVDVPSTLDGLLVLTQDERHFFTQTDLTYYVTDDFKVSVGYRYLNETSFAGAGAEYLFRAYDVPMSIFAKGDFGDENYTRVTGGLKVYLGESPAKSLISRQRTADPENYTPVFPTLRTQPANAGGGGGLPQCQVTVPTNIVTSPANGQCICPPGSHLSGKNPVPVKSGFSCGGTPA